MKLAFITTVFAAIVAMAPVPALAQWAPYPTVNIPKTKDGKPNLNAPAPRTADGHPDLSGVWNNPPCKDPCPVGLHDELLPLSAQFIDIAWGMKEPLPYKPWAADLVKKRMANFGRDNPDAHCKPIGVVQLLTHPYVRRIMQSPRVLAILNEKDNVFRQIFTDGRPMPEDPLPWWYGYSVGKWVGETLVVDTRYMRDEGWLDFRGAVITDEAKLTEKYRRPNFGNLEIELTIDDPKAYTRPWTVKINQKIVLDTDVFEFFCGENEKSTEHFK
jgi:hypothetical protein